MKYKNKLSICMMVKNEEKYLEQSLKSLQPFFDSFPTELIIVDTGSEDNTVAIAKKYTDKVYFHQWNNDFGSMRNKTIQYATSQWILILDGDEVFEKIDPLIEFLNSPISDQYNTISISIRNITSKKEEETYEQKGDILRLFKNSKDFKYRGTIHEQPLFKNPVYFSNAELVHYGYDSTDPQLMEYKFKRNVELLEKELEKDPNNIYNLFQLSQSYGMYGNYKKSLEVISKAYNLVSKSNGDHRNYLNIYNQLARAYYQNGKHEQLEKICIKALKIEDKFIDFYYYIAIAQSVLSKDKKAIENFEKYLKLFKQEGKQKEAKDLILVKGTLGFYENVNLNLAVLHKKNGNNIKALKYIEEITKDNFSRQSTALLVELYVELKKYKELKLKYDEILNMEKVDEKILHTFWASLENSMEKQNDSENEKLVKLFSTEDCNYSLLNKVRLNINEDKNNIDFKLIEKIKTLNFKTLPVFFAHLVYPLLIKKDTQIGEILYNVKQNLLESYVQYLINKYDEEIKDIALEYLDTMNNNRSFSEIRFQKELKKGLLINNIIEYDKYKDMFNSYTDDGIYYINEIYNKNIIENANVYDVKSDEDAFLIYMYLARKVQLKDELKYVRYLRKVLKIYPTMKQGIEILTKAIGQSSDKKDIEKSKEEPNEEFNDLKIKVKENINILLQSEKIMEAKLVIDEYLKIVPDDLEMLMLKSEILLKLI